MGTDWTTDGWLFETEINGILDDQVCGFHLVIFAMAIWEKKAKTAHPRVRDGD